ncbi:MAG TPA: DUF3435 domain-containing protein [Aggregatilineaceae bacterium]|nr:DUF3435 domain-containing protein [Aggregatilineaceae bacterium]
MKLREALEHFLNVNRADSTRETYAKLLRKFVADIGPERPLELISENDLNVYIAEMRHRSTKYEQHPYRPTEEAKLSSSTVYKNIKTLKTFFRWCVQKGHLVVSPAKDITNPKPQRPIGLGKAATDDEADLLLAGTQFKPRDRALVFLLAQSGCRAGEAAGLLIDDLNLDNLSAMVNGKGDKRREIYFGAETTAAMRAWLVLRPKVKHRHVFTSTRDGGKPLTADAVSRVVRRLCKKVGLERSLGSHSLRHRVGTKFAREHVPVRVAQAYLGHARPEITFGYYQDVSDQDLRNASRLLSSDLPPSNPEELREKQKADEIITRFRRLGTQ